MLKTIVGTVRAPENGNGTITFPFLWRSDATGTIYLRREGNRDMVMTGDEHTPPGTQVDTSTLDYMAWRHRLLPHEAVTFYNTD